MSATQKKKLCWNCEGRVSFEEENCPYCSVYLGPASDEQGSGDLLAPPYRLIEEEEEERKPEAFESAYRVQKEEGDQKEAPDLGEAGRDLKEVVFPLGLLSGGALFFLFGFMLLIFSDHGRLTLSWSADYWYLYILFGFPALLFGWAVLGRVERS